ncbi:DUF4282 domain-containing protein [Actinomadura harenae]|uniref:DUF4282 domain-containing protein n=1 Tax=Actinomadura harenae TaxID=2483351 RepID=A0A3M2LNK9_9ACTN|nr:DUF4282 domain-containing protein [Actinomadura harenae]RMI39051.1 DUF4282 domain-containing protein [Actinomadura harenae]
MTPRAPTPPYRRRGKSTARLLMSADFSHYVTTRILRAGYCVVVAMTGGAVLAGFWIAHGLQTIRWIGWGIPALIYTFAPLLGILWLALARVWFEYLGVIFGIAARVHDLDAKVGYLADRAHAAERSARAPGTSRPTP